MISFGESSPRDLEINLVRVCTTCWVSIVCGTGKFPTAFFHLRRKSFDPHFGALGKRANANIEGSEGQTGRTQRFGKSRQDDRREWDKRCQCRDYRIPTQPEPPNRGRSCRNVDFPRETWFGRQTPFIRMTWFSGCGGFPSGNPVPACCMLLKRVKKKPIKSRYRKLDLTNCRSFEAIDAFLRGYYKHNFADQNVSGSRGRIRNPRPTCVCRIERHLPACRRSFRWEGRCRTTRRNSRRRIGRCVSLQLPEPPRALFLPRKCCVWTYAVGWIDQSAPPMPKTSSWCNLIGGGTIVGNTLSLSRQTEVFVRSCCCSGGGQRNY